MIPAWNCFDAARKVQPEHPSSQDIDRIEKHYEFLLPQFFQQKK